MYKVAVILNESETQRYGWANVMPVLRKSVDHHEYEFDAYTVANMDDFFYKSSRYDSVFITTNACNDELLHSQLVAHKSEICDFLRSGKGMFVSFQKRLADLSCSTGFLPDEYEYQISGRKESSSEGTIKVPDGSQDNILLRFPKRTSRDEILHRCKHNEFKEHLYRALLIPKNPYNFTPVLVYDSYAEIRQILICSRYDFRARVVISTMSLDWEGHVNLLGNIVSFISEGLPLVAFVGKKNSELLDYAYLVSSMKFHKIPSRTYEVDSLEDSAIRTDVHKFYVFGAGWSEEECAKYWGRLHACDQDCRVYFFKKTQGVPSLVEYSKFSFSHSIILESVAWINSRFRNGRFQSSFWITHDVVEMLTSLGMPLDSVKQDILHSVREHDRDGSYDGLMGSTCALVEMYNWLLGRDSEQYRKSLKWIKENVHKASDYDQQTVIITLARLGENYDSEIYKRIYSRLLDTPESTRKETTELDLCRNAQFCLLERSDSALEWVKALGQSQGTDGKWTNAARTATTVIFLISNRAKLSGAGREVDQMIYKGISFLFSEFNKSGACWYGDTLTTAKAVQALKMFQRLLEYPVEEAFLSIWRQHETISNTQSSSYANLAIEGIRKELANAKETLRKQEKAIAYYERINARFNFTKNMIILVLVTVGALTLYVVHKELQGVILGIMKDFIKDFKYTIPTVIVFGIGTWLHVVFIRMAEKKSLGTHHKIDDV
jgi:hypothetical protein